MTPIILGINFTMRIKVPSHLINYYPSVRKCSVYLDYLVNHIQKHLISNSYLVSHIVMTGQIWFHRLSKKWHWFLKPIPLLLHKFYYLQISNQELPMSWLLLSQEVVVRGHLSCVIVISTPGIALTSNIWVKNTRTWSYRHLRRG